MDPEGSVTVSFPLFHAGYDLLLPPPGHEAEAHPAICPVLHSRRHGNLAAESGMAFLGRLHCLGARLHGSSDDSICRPSPHPLPALRACRASPRLADARRNREGRIQASCWNAGAAAPPFIRTPISHGRGKAFAAVSFPRMNGKKNLPVNKPGLLPPERKAGRTRFSLNLTEEKINGLSWKPSHNSSCAGQREWWGARW